jgi:hypothetical protein
VNVLFVGTECAGFVKNLSAGLENLGIQTFRYKYFDPFSYTEVTKVDRKQNSLMSKIKARVPERFFRKAYNLLKLMIFVWKIDVFVYNFGHTVSDTRFELFFLKLAGKKLFFVFHGSEIRPIFLNGKEFENVDLTKIDFLQVRESFLQQVYKAKLAQKYATGIISWCSISQLFTQSFYSHENMGFPISPELPPTERIIGRGGILKVLHAPSSYFAKGTERIRTAIESLQDEGFPIEYQELHGVTNSQVIAELRDADLVIDQIYSDSPAGAFAGEAGMIGVCVLICGRTFDFYENNLMGIQVAPTYFVPTHSFENTLKELLLNPDERSKSANELHSFITSHWNLRVVAEKYLQIFSGGLEEEKISPGEIQEIFGGFCDENRLSGIVSEYFRLFPNDLNLVDPFYKRQIAISDLTRNPLHRF